MLPPIPTYSETTKWGSHSAHSSQQIICTIYIHSIQHLKQRIRQDAASVAPDILVWVW
jgi:hypothetical protein